MGVRKLIIVLTFAVFLTPLWAQMPGGVPVERSNVVQTVGGKQFYIHIVQRGQTVYAISRAYGVKDYDAVVKKDIHFLSVGDTVWIPVAKVNAENIPATPPTVAEAAQHKDAYHEQPKRDAAPAVIRERIDRNTVVVSLLMPLYLNQLSEISTTKFDVEQRGRKNYRQFEFLQFYEGLQMGLSRLQQQGVNVRLNVVDISASGSSSLEKEWQSHQVGQSDVVIALLPREPFAQAAQLASRDHVFIVNPLSTRSEIIEDNPYVVKCQPSISARITKLLTYLQHSKPSAHLFIIHSKSANEKMVMEDAQRQLLNYTDIHYTIFDWSASGKLATALKNKQQVVVLSVYDQGKDRNRTFASSLLNRLSEASSNSDVTLVSLDNWVELYRDIDLAFLNNMHYHTFLPNEWDYSNTDHREFLRDFYHQYHVEPTNYLAAMGYDAILYFVTGLNDYGTGFWNNPNFRTPPRGLLRPLSLQHTSSSAGYEGSEAQLYRMSNYQFIECR